MDVQLQELIDKIKKDGVASAETAAADIIAEAEKKAAALVAEAENKAADIIKSAKAETERLEKASIDAVSQASRNVLIAFRDGINAQLDAFIKTETEKAYSADMLKTLIPETIKLWATHPDSEGISVLLSEKDRKVLESGFMSALKEQIAKGLEIKTDANLSSGFRIGTKDGRAYYDFSAEAVANLFAAYLNTRTAEILKNAAANTEGSR